MVLNLFCKTTSGEQNSGNSNLNTWMEGKGPDCPEGTAYRKIWASKWFALMQPDRPRRYILNFGMVVRLRNASSDGMKIAIFPNVYMNAGGFR